RKHPEQQYIQLDTTQILFICGGTFDGLEDIIKKRLGRQLIGFSSEQVAEQTPAEHSTTLARVVPEDLVHYGMIPEIIGRLPCITTLSDLDAEAMVQILTEPRNALVKQYQRFFEMEDTALKFTDDALREIANQALERDVGARALRSVVEGLMLELMYELPEKKEENATYEITADMVAGRVEASLFTARKVKKESA
ncbi:MAG: AAA family ATPase, partial [Phycisphaerae bacterium]|nr:AAA family ATPase [Phycisphaerae bacterium]